MSLTLKPQVRVRAKISSVGTYVPPKLLTNADLEKMVATNDQWIQERTGIRERHIVEPGVATSDMAVEAARVSIGPPINVIVGGWTGSLAAASSEIAAITGTAG